MKATDVVQGLERRHEPIGREWAFFKELRAGTGYSIYNFEKQLYNPEQRYDAWAINLYPSKNHDRIAYEIKVSRSDFLNEIKNPKKREQALNLSNYFYFATPKGLVSVEEIPEECGLIEVDNNLHSIIIKKAPYGNTDLLLWQFLCSIARRASVAEVKVKKLEIQNKELI